MTWQLRHEWVEGPRLGGAQLATCRHCGTLRTVDRSWDGRLSLTSSTTYTRPGITTNEAERVRTDEPPCVAPETSAAVVAARNAQRKEEERRAAVAAAIERAPEDDPEPAPPAKDAFPWPSNLLKW